MSELMINIITGYKPNKDYKAIRLPWGGGLQAMMDGKLDVYVRPAAAGSASAAVVAVGKARVGSGGREASQAEPRRGKPSKPSPRQKSQGLLESTLGFGV